MQTGQVSNNSYYAQCISLGWFCGMAGAMSANGLRSFSGPFDWCFSQLSSVLLMMDTAFSDFLNKENLQSVENKPFEFFDSKYDFYYNHDIKTNLTDDYEEIRGKYKRRTDRFMNAIKKPTCFLRMIRDTNEVNYINKNRQYIESIVKKENPRNKIVFFTLRGMDMPVWGQSFQLIVTDYNSAITFVSFHQLFDHIQEIQNYIVDLLAPEVRNENLLFHHNKHYEQLVLQNNPQMILDISDDSPFIKSFLLRFFSHRDWYIWGAGRYGNKLKKLLDWAGVRICGFIDNSPEKQGKNIENIKIYRWENVAEKAKNIFIAMKDKNTEEQIKTQIHDKALQVATYNFTDLLAYVIKNKE